MNAASNMVWSRGVGVCKAGFHITSDRSHSRPGHDHPSYLRPLSERMVHLRFCEPLRLLDASPTLRILDSLQERGVSAFRVESEHCAPVKQHAPVHPDPCATERCGEHRRGHHVEHVLVLLHPALQL